MEGNLGACLSVLSVCPSIRPSFPTVFFSLLSFFSPSSSLSHNCLLLWPPLPILSFSSTLGAAARTPCGLSCAKHIRRITAWLLSQHRVSLGLGPPQTAYPHPGKSAGPSEACLLLCPCPLLLSPVWLSTLRELLESYPWLVVRIVWGVGTAWYSSAFSMHSPTYPRASSRVPAASQSSGCYDSDSLEMPRPEEGPSEDSGPGGLGSRAQATNGGSERSQPPRSSGLRRQAIQNWQRRPRGHSTEGEEGDVSDVGSRTTESEAEGPSDVTRPGPAVAGPLNSCRLSGES